MNCQELFYLCLALCGVLLAMLTMFFNYNLKLKDKSLELSQRTKELEKKNGHEQHQIDELKSQIETLKASLKPTNSIPPAPPAPEAKFKPNNLANQPESHSPQADLLTELKTKQQAGKLKPSQIKD